jgi:hypothetical protein
VAAVAAATVANRERRFTGCRSIKEPDSAPGPYQGACAVANCFKHFNPTSKVLVLDDYWTPTGRLLDAYPQVQNKNALGWADHIWADMLGA